MEQPDPLHHLAVQIHVEADLVAVELLGAVDVRDRQQDDFEAHVHGVTPLTTSVQRAVLRSATASG
jgi:hypothetical protein